MRPSPERQEDLRRLAMQVALQLPQSRLEAALVLEYARELVRFLAGDGLGAVIPFPAPPGNATRFGGTADVLHEADRVGALDPAINPIEAHAH
jgi:hypothetical protein